MGKTPPKGKEAEGSPQKKPPRVDDAALTTVPVASAPNPTGKTPPKGEEAEGSPRKKAARVDDAAPMTVPVASAPSPTRKTPPKGGEAEGSPRKKSPRVDDAALITVPVASAPPSPTGKTPPKGEEAEGSPQKKAARVDDAALTTVPVASAPSPTRKTPPKGGEAEGSPRKKALRLDDAALATVPVASEPNPTGKAQPQGEADGSPPKRSRSPRNKSPRRQGKWPAAAVPLATVPESSELIVERAEGSSDEKRCTCNHVITVRATNELVNSLDSKFAWTCQDCLDEKNKYKTRPEMSDLLICVTCYRHLCCGVGSIAYPFGHSRAHGLEEHCFAFLYSDPERGYCFKCNAEVPMPVKFGEGGNEASLEAVQLIRSILCELPAFPTSAGQTEAEVIPEKLEMTGKVQAESSPFAFGVDLADKWPSCESRSSDVQMAGKVQEGSRPSGPVVDPADQWLSYDSTSSDAQGYAIRGIPNLGNTCYMSAVLQCLFVLGKLRERMLALDRPKGPLTKALKDLFVEANAVGHLLNPNEVLNCVNERDEEFKVGAMQDSHDLLTLMRAICNKESDGRQSGAPTVMDSTFEFEMAETLCCRKCGYLQAPVPSLHQDVLLGFPSEGHPTKSAALPQTSREITVPADVQRNLEKMQRVSASGYSRVIGSEVIVEATPLAVDSTKALFFSQSKDVVQSPLQIQEGKSVDSLTADSISIDDLLLHFTEDKVAWRCPNCAKDHEEPSASQSKNGEQTVGSGNEDTAVVGDQIEQSDRTACHSKESECHGGILQAGKHTDLLGTNQSADASMHLETVKQSEQGCTAYLLKDGENEQKDDVGYKNIKMDRFTVLPPVLTLHLKRTLYDNVGPFGLKKNVDPGRKISGHVRFMEYLDVKRFMDPSSVDKGSTLYRLAGVVEHIGEKSLKAGHYIAYVRARRLGNQQEGSSCSSSWFCANDREIRRVTLEKVLDSEAYILFYERMEDQEKVEMTGKVQAESRPSAFGVDLADKWPSCESKSSDVQMVGKVQEGSRPSGSVVDLADRWPSYDSTSSDAQGYAIRGIPNLGNTCYMNALLQCLFVLGKLRERMLSLDRPKGLLPELLKELFVEASAAGDVLDPTKLLTCVGMCKVPLFQVGTMEDSHELLTVLRDIWNQGEAIYNRQSDALTVLDSIFRFEMVLTVSCKRCGHSSSHSEPYWDLSLNFPSKWHPTKSAASPQTSEIQLFPADVQRNLDKMQTVSESDHSRVIDSEVIMEETHKPLEVDSTQAQRISQSKDVVRSPLPIQGGKSPDSLTEDSISIEDFLVLFLEDQVKWACPNCAKDHEEPSASQSKNGDAVSANRFASLPPVLILHLKRTAKVTLMDNNTDGIKISGHVEFMEYLDVERFMERSSVDKGSTLYRLAGVVEHIGKKSLKEGHYIAYVRARRLGNQQEGSSCSSSWFCANDREITQVTLEQVRNSEAYILFYERMEDQDISGIRHQN